MNQFLFKNFTSDFTTFEQLAGSVSVKARDNPSDKFTAKHSSAYKSLIVEPMAIHCGRLELIRAAGLLKYIMTMLDGNYYSNISAASEAFDTFIQTVKDEMREKTFAFIPGDRSKFFEQEDLFGREVSDKFPSTKEEIKAAGNCVAADLNTAAVFHLMRTVEIGMRFFARHLKVKGWRAVEHREWGKVIKAANDRLEVMKKRPRSTKREQEIEFYSGLVGELNAFKDVWRNNVMHTRESYDAHQAMHVFNHVKAFMGRLATKVHE